METLPPEDTIHYQLYPADTDSLQQLLSNVEGVVSELTHQYMWYYEPFQLAAVTEWRGTCVGYNCFTSGPVSQRNRSPARLAPPGPISLARLAPRAVFASEIGPPRTNLASEIGLPSANLVPPLSFTTDHPFVLLNWLLLSA